MTLTTFYEIENLDDLIQHFEARAAERLDARDGVEAEASGPKKERRMRQEAEAGAWKEAAQVLRMCRFKPGLSGRAEIIAQIKWLRDGAIVLGVHRQAIEALDMAWKIASDPAFSPAIDGTVIEAEDPDLKT